jgi:DNA-binding transcriptional MerR regulator
VPNIPDQNLHTLLTIGDLASRTGVRVATLREWERRHGFPAPAERLPSGHRRYTDIQADQVRAVVARQRAGLSLAAAIRGVQPEAPGDTSIFSAVAAASTRPAARRTRRGMLAISRAIEDACAAAGDLDVVIGSFQREEVFRGCEARWRALAGIARVCVVLADFDEVRVHDGIVEVPIDAAPPLAREWAIAVVGRRVEACLSGWEWPGAEGPFEAVWSVEPDVVRAAVDRVLGVARHRAADAVGDVAVAAGQASVGDALELMDRILRRLDPVLPG